MQSHNPSATHTHSAAHAAAFTVIALCEKSQVNSWGKNVSWALAETFLWLRFKCHPLDVSHSHQDDKLTLNHFSNRKLPSLHLSSFNLLMKPNSPSKGEILFKNYTTMLSSVGMVKAQQTPNCGRTKPGFFYFKHLQTLKNFYQHITLPR